MPKIIIPAEVLFERIGDETVLLQLESGVYFGLNQTGSRMWQLLAETGDPRAVLERMQKEFDVSGETLEQDLSRLLEQLIEKNLVEVNGDLSVSEITSRRDE